MELGWLVFKMWVLVALGYALTERVTSRKRTIRVRHISKSGDEAVIYLRKGESRVVDDLIDRAKRGIR